MLCLSDTTLLGGSGCDSREELAGGSLNDGTRSSTRFSVNSDRSRKGFPLTRSVSLLLFLFSVSVDSCKWSPSTGLLVL